MWHCTSSCDNWQQFFLADQLHWNRPGVHSWFTTLHIATAPFVTYHIAIVLFATDYIAIVLFATYRSALALAICNTRRMQRAWTVDNWANAAENQRDTCHLSYSPRGRVEEEHLKSYGLYPYCYIVVIHSRWKLQKGQEGLEIAEDNWIHNKRECLRDDLP